MEERSPDAYASFGARLVAYLIDVLPITLMVAAAFYAFFGFDEVLRAYLEREPGDSEARYRFLVERNKIRNLSFLLWVVYGAVLEGSPLQATVGKRLMGIRVVDRFGGDMTLPRALSRNSLKTLSALPCLMGFLWSLWSKRKQAWHDMLAGALVVRA